MKHHRTLFVSLLGKTLLMGLAALLMLGSEWPNARSSASVQLPPPSELRQPKSEKSPWLVSSQAPSQATVISQPDYSERLPRWVF